jgi:hypothetical protein
VAQATRPRRAPRLGPDEFIAGHITRLGRFRKRDPRVARKLPGCSRTLGVVAWAVFLAEVLRRARRAQPEDSGPSAVA